MGLSGECGHTPSYQIDEKIWIKPKSLSGEEPRKTDSGM